MAKIIVEITSKDYWFKIVEMLQQNWALIDKTENSSGCIIYFVNDGTDLVFLTVSNFPSKKKRYMH